MMYELDDQLWLIGKPKTSRNTKIKCQSKEHGMKAGSKGATGRPDV